MLGLVAVNKTWV